MHEEIANEVQKWYPTNILFRIAGWWLKKHPRQKRLVVVICLIVIALVYFTIFYIENYNTPKTLGLETTEEIQHNFELPGESEDSLQKRFIDEKNTKKCDGVEFNVLQEGFLPVGGERFTFESEGENIVSVREVENYQAVVRSLWGCKMPYVAKVRIFPQKGNSLGLILEFENVFRVVVGDGDRKTIKVQQNKWKIRGQWPEVKMENNRLSYPIEDGEEVLLTVGAKVVNNEVLLDIEIQHSKYLSSDKFTAHFIPNGTNFNANQSERFRIGINDSFYKGLGSVVKFDNFSVKEINK